MVRQGEGEGPSSRRVSYEIVPGAFFPSPTNLKSASFAERLKWQRRAEELFSDELLKRLNLSSTKTRAEVARGGWQGSVNPSTQVIFSGDAPPELLRVYAAALGLIWRQDAVAVSRLHPSGRCTVIRISRADGKKLTGAQIDRFYRILYQSDDAKRATIGFTEHDGTMLFINLPGGMSDKEFESVLVRLAQEHLPDEVFLDFARADFELESSDWSSDHGESYRQRLREAGRSDLLDWIETIARHEAQRFLAQIPSKPRPPRQSRGRKSG